MGSMSYCRFENTLRDLRDCYENMDQCLSDDEEKAKRQMIQLCKQIADDYGDEHDQ